jgi:hypothetical protein
MEFTFIVTGFWIVKYEPNGPARSGGWRRITDQSLIGGSHRQPGNSVVCVDKLCPIQSGRTYDRAKRGQPGRRRASRTKHIKTSPLQPIRCNQTGYAGTYYNNGFNRIRMARI